MNHKDWFLVAVVTAVLAWRCPAAQVFRVATYNVENYLQEAVGTRPAKSAEARAKIRESILSLKPDVIAFQEMGPINALLELRASLKADGLEFPHWEHVTGFDTNIHVAVLSRFPIRSRHPYTNDTFLLSGRRFRVSRGFAEVQIEVSPNYSFTLITAHLKSRRQVPEADEAELRLQEAMVLRDKVDAMLARNPNTNFLVLGDFNDTYDTPSTRAIVGRGRRQLVDTRPAERNGDDRPNPNPRYQPRHITWPHYYGVEDSYSRIDYILLSPGMASEWVKSETWLATIPNWGIGSDHRPLLATFVAEDK